jgi:hypothetical protein
MQYPVPVCATVSRSTGEITVEIIDDFDACRRFGEILLRIGREYERNRETRDAGEEAPA